MTDALDPEFAQALRRELVTTVEHEARPVQHWGAHTRRAWLIGGLTAALVGGADVATAVLAGTPGGEIITPVAGDVTVEGQGPGTIDLGPAPERAARIDWTLDCVTAAWVTIDGGGSVRCGAGGRSGGQLSLDATPDGIITVTAGADDGWSITATYVAVEPIPLATNDNGETYGTDADDAAPDLILAWATNGREGYVRRSELDTAYGPEPTSPAHALEIQEQRPPGPAYIPVYESDGVTVIGEFEVGG